MRETVKCRKSCNSSGRSM